MYWRRFPISSIPLDNPKAFDLWLRARWTEKDNLIEGYLRTGRFPADKGVSKTSDGKIRRGAGYIKTEIKPQNWYEFLQVFAPLGLFALVLYMFYGALPKEYSKSINNAAMVKKILSMESKQIEGLETKKLIDFAQSIVGSNLTELKKVATSQKESVTTRENQDLLKRILAIQKSGIQGPEARELIGLAQKYISADINTTPKNEAAKEISNHEKLDRQALLNKVVLIQKNGIQGPESEQLINLAQKYMGSEIPGLNELLARQKKTPNNVSAPKVLASKVSSQKTKIQPKPSTVPSQKPTTVNKTPTKAPSKPSASHKPPSVASAKGKTADKPIKPPQQTKAISKPPPPKRTQPVNTPPKKPDPKPKATPAASKVVSTPKTSTSKTPPTKPKPHPTPKKPQKT